MAFTSFPIPTTLLNAQAIADAEANALAAAASRSAAAASAIQADDAATAAAASAAGIPAAGLIGIMINSRAEALLAHIPPGTKSILVVEGDLVLFYEYDIAGTALETADGATWSPVGDVYVEHFGSVGDGDEAKATANTSAWFAALAWVEAQIATTVRQGIELRFCGRHVTNATLTWNADRVALIGISGAGPNAAGSDIRGAHLVGPVLRVKGNRPTLRNFVTSVTAARRVARRVTAANYTSLGLVRDDQNYGIWIEADDNGTDYVDEFCIDNVWAHNQPNAGIVVVGGAYHGVIDQSGANNCLHHGG